MDKIRGEVKTERLSIRKASAKIVKAIKNVWGDENPEICKKNWLFVYWLIQKQLEEIEEKNFDAHVMLKEYADIAIIIIEFFSNLGLDPEKVILKRLKKHHEGRAEEIAKKYREMWEAEH